MERTGGARNVKAFENKYDEISAIIAKAQLVPTRNVQRNQYGNVSRALIVRLGEAAQSGNGDVFIGQPVGQRGKPRAFGVYQRDRNTKQLRALFIQPKSAPNYKAVLQLQPALADFASERFDFHLTNSINLALLTAR